MDPLAVAAAAALPLHNGGRHGAAPEGGTTPLISSAFSTTTADPTGARDDNGTDSDDEAECRVCRGEAEPDRRLFAPCKCSGSIRFTHSDCLEQWLEHSGKSFCELCGHKFEFKPRYDANAPDVLPWSELLSTVASMACFKWAPFIVRAVLVVVLWLGLAPWCTSWLYRMWLLRASAMINVNFAERFDTAHVVADIYAGIILIVVIIFSFLALMSFADFLRFHLDHIDEPVDEPLHGPVNPHHNHHRHHNHNHQHLPLAGNANANAAPAALPPAPLQAVQPVVRDDRPPLFGDLDDDDSDEERDDRHDENAVMPFAGVFDRHPREDLGLPGLGEDIQPPEQALLQELRQRRVLHAPRDINVAPNNNRIPAPPLAPRNAPALPMPPPPPRNNRPNPPAGNNRDVWEDDFEHMEINIAMDELLGLRGDVIVLFRNVSWLLAFNGAYLGLFAFIPYTLGSTILSATMKIYSALPPTPLSPAILDESVAMDQLPIGQFFIRVLIKAVGDAKKNGDCLQLVDLCTCFFGYLSICFTIVLWRWMVNTASPFIHRPLMGGVTWALRCLSAIVKVSTLLMLKMVVLPIVLGFGIDVATLRLFHVTLQDQIVFCFTNMIGALLVHWVLGITFMLFITVSVLQLREVMHPDILAKVIRPQEAHPDLLRSLLSETCMKHARRMLLSLVIYAALLIVLIHVPIRLYETAAPNLFPLVLRFQHYCPEVQVPIELLVVHLVVLGILEHAKNEIGRLQHVGIAFFCSQLGLTEYLLPRVEVKWPSRVDVLGDDYVLGPPPLHFHPQNVLPPEELRIGGRRYLPWPEDGLEDPQPVEYELLVRQTPTKWLHGRVATLAVVTWLVLVSLLGALIFGTFFLGRACMAPFERLTGISHDPIALAAGVQIVWYIANGLNALSMITLPEDQVEPALVRRGYCVKNMTPENAIACVVGWAFLGPFFVGYIMSACFPDAGATWFEAFWMGYLVFNLTTWFVCGFRMKRNRRRRRDREQDLVDDEFDENFDDFIEQDDLLDDMEDDLDDEEELLNEVAGLHRNGDRDDDNGAAQPPQIQEPGVEVEGIVAAMRKCYKQLMFNVQVHDNDAVRLRDNNIRDRCFDIAVFMESVMYPILGNLLTVILVCSLQSAALVYLWPSSSSLSDTAFAISALGTGAVFGVVRCGSYASHWTAAFAESIRNERYLIGRELQDMVR